MSGAKLRTTQLHSSLTLLERAQAGDREALESLIARYLPSPAALGERKAAAMGA